ncbi:hypothetical protein QOT17_012663 [Balamuthia mandrillaris]
MKNQGFYVAFLLTLYLTKTLAVAPAVLDVRVENPFPPGSGTVVIVFQVDPEDANAANADTFKIISIGNIQGDSELYAWDAGTNTCSATALAASDEITVANGKACFVGGATPAEHVSSFTYVAVDADDADDESDTAATVYIYTYDQQDCSGIPDLGSAGSFSAPPAPSVTITLNGLQVQFQVDVAYIRNQSSYMIDFWDFDITPTTGDSADGAGRTCSNHDDANFVADFADWWFSSPQADYDSVVHASIPDALDNTDYMPYVTTGTEWAVTAVDCDTVRFTSSIPVSALVRNTEAGDCSYSGDTDPAASATGLDYTANLFVNVIRPRDEDDDAAGYYKTTFVFPFTFSIAETVTDLDVISEEWDFEVNILDFDVTHSGGNEGLVFTFRTLIQDPDRVTPVNSPNILQAGFAATNYPLKAARDAASEQPTLTRVGDNGNCAGSTNPCIITWTADFDELTQPQAGGESNFNAQYTGEFEFTWTTTGGDVLQANIYVDISAEDPDTDLGEIPVPSAIEFFETQAAMQLVDTNPTGMNPAVFSSGEDIWVRHSFLVDDADVQAFEFTLKQAFVCYSMVPGVSPSIAGAGTGCAADIDGVTEVGRGSRIVLFDETTLPGGIPDTAAGAGVLAKNWDWRQVDFDAANWENGQTVHNGFGIRAQPLVIDDEQRDWYFHIVSGVAQAPLKRRGSGAAKEVHTLIPMRRQSAQEYADSGQQLQSVTIIPEKQEEEDGGSANNIEPIFKLFL